VLSDSSVMSAAQLKRVQIGVGSVVTDDVIVRVVVGLLRGSCSDRSGLRSGRSKGKLTKV